MSERRLVLLALNEINFDIVRKYLESNSGLWPALARLFKCAAIRTTSEAQYENLEPWIQWPSIHTGKSFSEHQVFRLGDMVASEMPQIFEQIEALGLRVGAISAMNAVNRLQRPAYFIPDPWTKTSSDGSWWSRNLTSAIAQAVNDNSQGRITLGSGLVLALGLARYARPENYRRYLRLVTGVANAPWRKALVLDLFLHDLHLRLFDKARPQFSTLFMNAGAHIQHHYFLNAAPVKAASPLRNPTWYVAPDVDPVAEMLSVYNDIVDQYLRLSGVDVIVATGLSQRPYDRVKFYYRLKDHSSFLRLLGIRFRTVIPRMTRDFLVDFSSAADALDAERLLREIRVGDGEERLFEQIDNRGGSLFVTLTYPREIDSNLRMHVAGSSRRLHDHVVFVAVKNGMHQEEGFAFLTNGIASYAPTEGAHVKELYKTITRYFDAPALG